MVTSLIFVAGFSPSSSELKPFSFSVARLCPLCMRHPWMPWFFYGFRGSVPPLPSKSFKLLFGHVEEACSFPNGLAFPSSSLSPTTSFRVLSQKVARLLPPFDTDFLPFPPHERPAFRHPPSSNDDLSCLFFLRLPLLSFFK